MEEHNQKEGGQRSIQIGLNEGVGEKKIRKESDIRTEDGTKNKK